MSTQTDTARSDAIRAGLIAHAAATLPRKRLFAWGTVLVLVAGLAGAGVSAGAFAATGLSPDNIPPAPTFGDGIVIEAPHWQSTEGDAAPIDAPDGVVPGSPIITVIGDPAGYLVDTRKTIPLTERPATATHIRVTITCLRAGTISWGVDPQSNNPQSVCGPSDPGTAGATAWMDFPLEKSTEALYIVPESSSKVNAVIQYLSYLPTKLGVNPNGETYGIGTFPEGQPDLIAASGVDAEGRTIEGYVRAVDLTGFSPEHTRQPTSPAEALKWQQEREEQYAAGGWEIPLYGSDGTTQLGTFTVGG